MTETPQRLALFHAYELLKEMALQGAIPSEYAAAVNSAIAELYSALKQST